MRSSLAKVPGGPDKQDNVASMDEVLESIGSHGYCWAGGANEDGAGQVRWHERYRCRLVGAAEESRRMVHRSESRPIDEVGPVRGYL